MGENKPKVITICGSSKFCDIMAVVSWLLERDEGAMAMSLHLLPRWYSAEVIPDHLAEHEGVADKMDDLHMQKIRMSDEVFVVNYNDYIGDSTKKEVTLAEELKLPIRWYTHDPVGKKVDEIMDAARVFAQAKQEACEQS